MKTYTRKTLPHSIRNCEQGDVQEIKPVKENVVSLKREFKEEIYGLKEKLVRHYMGVQRKEAEPQK